MIQVYETYHVSNAIVAIHVNKFTAFLPAPEKYSGVESTEFQWVWWLFWLWYFVVVLFNTCSQRMICLDIVTCTFAVFLTTHFSRHSLWTLKFSRVLKRPFCILFSIIITVALNKYIYWPEHNGDVSPKD
jgi:hypothetical protein